jgi:S-adenosylmethionine:tRNA ribosyltransferase-isomerase
VIPARLWARKPTGGRVELLIERVLDDRRAFARIRASKVTRVGKCLGLATGEEVHVLGRDGERFEIAFPGGRPLPDLLEDLGEVPLPPYLGRAPEAVDAERYQTVFARRPGAIAAPTAGLHFDEDVLERVRASGVDLAFVTLHVGVGTFQPVRCEHVEQHAMHAEYAEVSQSVCQQVLDARRRGGRVIAVGTTTVRSLEAASQSGAIAPFSGETRLFIRPGYQFRCVDAMVTNFHLPESTLLMLVCAFAGREKVLAAYAHAVQVGYRFFSYGDAMFIAPEPSALADRRG